MGSGPRWASTTAGSSSGTRDRQSDASTGAQREAKSSPWPSPPKAIAWRPARPQALSSSGRSLPLPPRGSWRIGIARSTPWPSTPAGRGWRRAGRTGPRLLRVEGERRVAVGEAEGRVSVWSPGQDRAPVELGRLSGWIPSLAFSPDGSRLAAGSYDGETHVWTLSWRQLLGILRHSTSACLSPDERRTYLGETATTARAAADRCERARGEGFHP